MPHNVMYYKTTLLQNCILKVVQMLGGIDFIILLRGMPVYKNYLVQTLGQNCEILD